MNKTTTAPALKLGQTVIWKSGAAGVMKTKKGKIVGLIAAGKVPAMTKFPTLRAAGKARKITSFIVDVNGKQYWPRTALLKKA